MFLTPVVLLFLLWLGPGVAAAVGLTRAMVPPLVGSLVLGYFLNYYLKVSLGLLALWMTESVGVFNIFFLLQFLFEGTLMPLNLLPAWAQRVGDTMPFRYFYFLSMSILQGKIGAETVYHELAIQAVWCAGAYVLMKVVYGLGVRQYSAVGG